MLSSCGKFHKGTLPCDSETQFVHPGGDVPSGLEELQKS